MLVNGDRIIGKYFSNENENPVPTYQKRLVKRITLEVELHTAKAVKRESALTQVRQLVGEFDISAQEIFPAHQPRRHSRHDAKYRHPESGETWSGRGRPPGWIVGKDRTLFET
ncbi:H-NS histone family protein [Burkholderia sp. FERM BP-3421]|jgi:DNA-binding protein H-NS|uniref:H-NS histone family protein n=1 Tax=Burkholderia sp. FERM BP-3421 TaxID=1494466 RepID=UPI003FCD5D03